MVDITNTLKIETPAKDVTSAFDEVKSLWISGKADYIAGAVLPEGDGDYFIYTPEKGVMTPDPTVEERIEFLKEMEKEDRFEL